MVTTRDMGVYTHLLLLQPVLLQLFKLHVALLHPRTSFGSAQMIGFQRSKFLSTTQQGIAQDKLSNGWHEVQVRCSAQVFKHYIALQSKGNYPIDGTRQVRCSAATDFKTISISLCAILVPSIFDGVSIYNKDQIPEYYRYCIHQNIDFHFIKKPIKTTF